MILISISLISLSFLCGFLTGEHQMEKQAQDRGFGQYRMFTNHNGSLRTKFFWNENK